MANIKHGLTPRVKCKTRKSIIMLTHYGLVICKVFDLPKFQDIVQSKFWKFWTFPNLRTISVYINVNFICLWYTWGQNVPLQNLASKNPAYGHWYLSQHWLRYWLVAWWHQAITWTNVGLPILGFYGIQPRTILYKLLKNQIQEMSLEITLLELHPHRPGFNGLNIM